VVVSIDPRRVYLRSPDEVQFKAVKLTTPGIILLPEKNIYNQYNFPVIDYSVN